LEEDAEKSLVSVLTGQVAKPPPIWLMRQAGRYLPEYREARAQAGSFWSMCTDPKVAVEVTLQPVRRFGFDAAIIFSDILTVPFALGCEVGFSDGSGPNLPPVNSICGLETRAEIWQPKLDPVYQALELVRTRLGSGTTLLGFAGAPWTLATYMAGGHGGDQQRAAKLWGYREPETFAALLELIGDCVAQHLIWQIEAGADVVQIFDSWAGGLPDQAYDSWVIGPTRSVVEKVRATHPQAKIIGFPRASTLAGYELYAARTGVDAISVDTAVPRIWMVKFTEATVVQGNLDPLLLVVGGSALERAVNCIVESMNDRRFIFNLGHGVLPETPPEHVTQLVAMVRAVR